MQSFFGHFLVIEFFNSHCRYLIVVDRTVFHEVIHACGTGKGYHVNLLALTARRSLLCCILLLASIQAVTDSIAFRVWRGRIRIP